MDGRVYICMFVCAWENMCVCVVSKVQPPLPNNPYLTSLNTVHQLQHRDEGGRESQFVLVIYGSLLNPVNFPL